MSIFSAIFHLIQSLFDSTKSAFDKLPANTQSELKDGSAILNIINVTSNEAPATVIATIQNAYPNLDPDLLYTGLAKVASGFKLNVPATLTELIPVLQGYLKSLDNGVWPSIIKAAAEIFTLVLSPATPVEIIATFAQWVYTNFVRSSTVTVVQAPTPTVTSALSTPTPSPASTPVAQSSSVDLSTPPKVVA